MAAPRRSFEVDVRRVSTSVQLGGGGLGAAASRRDSRRSALTVPLLAAAAGADVEDGASDPSRTHLHAPAGRLRHALVFAALVAAFIGSQLLIGHPFARRCPGDAGVCGYHGCLRGGEFFGVVLALVALPASVLPLGWFMQGPCGCVGVGVCGCVGVWACIGVHVYVCCWLHMCTLRFAVR